MYVEEHIASRSKLTDFMEKHLKEYAEYMIQAESPEKAGPSPPLWLFRGVSNKDYELVPTIGRKTARIPAFSYNTSDEQALFRAFQAEARPYLKYEPKSTLEWLAIAQHNRVPTRLLDWTESFLTALFFAVQNGGQKDGKKIMPAIYATKRVPFCDSNKDPFSISKLFAYTPPHISPQIPAQRSVLTIHPEPAQEPQYSELMKITIEQRECMPFKLMLAQQGITRGSLFPTIDGLADQLIWDYKWNLLSKYHLAD